MPSFQDIYTTGCSSVDLKPKESMNLIDHSHNEFGSPYRVQQTELAGSSSIASSKVLFCLGSPLQTSLPETFRRVKSPIVSTKKQRLLKQRKFRSPWTEEENDRLRLILKKKKGEPGGDALIWNSVANELGTGRNGKQCRDRWQNYLRPGIKKGDWTPEEEELIRELHKTFGPRWSAMAKMLPNRTDNDIKNKWYSMARSEQRCNAKSRQFEQSPNEWNLDVAYVHPESYELFVHNSRDGNTFIDTAEAPLATTVEPAFADRQVFESKKPTLSIFDYDVKFSPYATEINHDRSTGSPSDQYATPTAV